MGVALLLYMLGYIHTSNMKKFNWKSLLLDIIKVLGGALAGWLGTS